MQEFDRISKDYSAGFDDPVKKIFGESARSFLLPKIKLLTKALRRERADLILCPAVLLDFGCGAGDFLGEIAEIFPHWRLEGCDVSTGMLTEARKRLGAKVEKIKLWEISDGSITTCKYDVITVVCVLHHILPEMWSDSLKNVTAALKPGGMLAVFEHNPWNPITRWMVSRTVVDLNAHLLSAPVLKRHLPTQEFKSIELRNFFFFPPRLDFLAFSEIWLGGIPMGGQYALFAWKK
jgi:SAM-dependent methyltransferase